MTPETDVIKVLNDARNAMEKADDIAKFPRYLGDSVYASFDGYQIKLWTCNGAEVDQIIYLDDGVQHNLVRLFAEIAEARRLCNEFVQAVTT